MGVGALLGVEVVVGRGAVEVGVEELLRKSYSLVLGLFAFYWPGLRMFCPKDSAQCCGDGDDSNKSHSCKDKEPRLPQATDPALPHRFCLS